MPLPQALGTALRNRAFLHLLGMNFSAIVGMFAPVTATLLLSIHFLFQGDQDGAATLTGATGLAQMLGALAGVPVNTWVSVRLGKRRAALGALALGAIGFASLWLTFRPAHPSWALASYFWIGWGMQGVWLMSATMTADVCDDDEVASGRRREGLYGAVFGVEQKLAFAAAALLGGYLVGFAGYATSASPSPATLENLRLVLVATPLAGLALGALSIWFYPLSRTRVGEIQALLARRRAAAHERR